MTQSISVTFYRKELRDALARIKPAVARRHTLAILGCVMMDVCEDIVTIAATDLETYGTTTVPAAATIGQGRTAIDHKVLSATVRGMKSDTVTLTFPATHRAGDTVTLTSGDGARSELPTFDPGAFPMPPTESPTTGGFTMDSAAFRGLVDVVRRAASPDITRVVLTGIHLRFGADMVCGEATDSYRLTQVVAEDVSSWGESTGDVLVDARALTAVAGAAKRSPEVEILTSDTTPHVGIHFGRGTDTPTYFALRRIEGRYPDLGRHIGVREGKEDTCTVEADATEMHDAWSALAAHIGKATVPMVVTVADGAMRCEVTVPDKGTMVRPIPSARVSGDIVIGLNAAFAADALAESKGTATLRFASPILPVLIDCGNRRSLVMPIRL